MREDLPSAELQNLYPVPGDGEVSQRWARSTNRACTAWLLRRGLLEPAAEDCSPGKKTDGAFAETGRNATFAKTEEGEEAP